MTSNSVLIPLFSSMEYLHNIALQRSIIADVIDTKQLNWIQYLNKIPSTFIIGIENNRFRNEITDLIKITRANDEKNFVNIFYFDPDYIDYKNFICKLCDTQVTTKKGLSQHRKSNKHLDNMKVNGYQVTIFICEICNPPKSYKSQSALNRHLETNKHLKIVQGEDSIHNQQIRQNLEELGFTILNEHISSVIDIKCKNGHVMQISTSKAKIKSTEYCRQCALENQSNAHEDLKKICDSQGLDLISEYKYGDERAMIRCRNCGVESNKLYYSIIYNSGCKSCSIIGSKKTIEYAREYGLRLGLKLLSTNYTCSKDKMEWECPEGHICHIAHNQVQQGRGCKQCFFEKKLTPKEDVIKLATSNGFEIIEFIGRYRGARGYIRLKCKKGHIILKSGLSISRETDCRICAFESMRKSIDEVRAEGLKIGLRLISTEYKGGYEYLEWECPEGHRLLRSYNTIRYSFGCTKCCSSKGQTLIRNILIEMKIPFEEEVKVIPTHRRYRFDFACTVNNQHVFIEYDGIPHFEVNNFGRSDDDFIKARNRDQFKQTFVINNGCKMIRIDYTIDDNEIKDYLLKGFQSSEKVYYSTPELYDWLE